MTFTKAQRMFIAIAIIVVLGSSAGGCSQQAVEDTGTTETVTIGVAVTPLSSPVIIANVQGYFTDNGLDVVMKEYASGRHALEGMFAGEVDISTVADTPIVFNSFERRDFRILATFVYSYEDSKIVTRKDTNINIGADLKGKKVGVQMGTSGHFFLASFLTHNHLLTSQVELIDIRTADLPVALQNNEVDAISAWEPFAYEARQLLEDKAVALPSSRICRTTFNFAVMEDFAKSHPEALQRFLRAVDKGARFTKTNKEESQAIISQSLEVDKEEIGLFWDDYMFEIFLDQSLLVGLEDIARWAIVNEFTDKTEVPNYLDYIYMDALEEVKSEAIGIIR